MSCDLVDENVINYLVYNFLFYKINTRLDPDDLGTNLLIENKESWEHRYNETVDQFFTVDYKYNKNIKYDDDPVQLIKTIEYYCYQSSEHPEWHTSDIKKNLYALKDSAINELIHIVKRKKIWGAPNPLGGISS